MGQCTPNRPLRACTVRRTFAPPPGRVVRRRRPGERSTCRPPLRLVGAPAHGPGHVAGDIADLAPAAAGPNTGELRRACPDPRWVVADGTTATLPTEAVYKKGLSDVVVSGINPVVMKRGVEAIVANLAKMKVEALTEQDFKDVAGVASNDDREIGKSTAQAMSKVGKDGVITVEEGMSTETNHEFVAGTQYDRGHLSPYFVTDPQKMGCELDELLILIVRKKVTSDCDLMPVLERVLSKNKPVLIVAKEVGRGAGHAGHRQAARHLPGRRGRGAGEGGRGKAMLEGVGSQDIDHCKTVEAIDN